MQEFLNWTVDTIREDRLISPWLEEKKYEWTPLVSKNIVNLLEKVASVIVLTDRDREWFLEYVLSNVNSPKLNRPFLPFYDFKSFYKYMDNIKSDDDITKIESLGIYSNLLIQLCKFECLLDLVVDHSIEGDSLFSIFDTPFHMVLYRLKV